MTVMTARLRECKVYNSRRQVCASTYIYIYIHAPSQTLAVGALNAISPTHRQAIRIAARSPFIIAQDNFFSELPC